MKGYRVELGKRQENKIFPRKPEKQHSLDHHQTEKQETLPGKNRVKDRRLRDGSGVIRILPALKLNQDEQSTSRPTSQEAE
jgi:hypothetical protein